MEEINLVTIYDIAKKCNVSAATVSKALNGYSDVSSKTKLLIQNTATEMGYSPNASAQTLSTKRSYNIGILLEEDTNRGLGHELFSKILETVRLELGKCGYDITFISNYTGKVKTTYLSHCKYRQVDGVIVVCVNFFSSEFVELIHSDIPVVVIDGNYDSVSNVASDNYNGMCELVSYLISQGHTKIGYIHGQKEGIVTPIRLKAYYDTLTSHNISINPDWIKLGGYYHLDITYEQAKQILTGTHKPTAIIISDDYVALSVYSLAKELGLSIPEDISVAGFDGIELSQVLNPRLTTVKQDTTKIGTLAAQKIISLIEDGAKNTSIKVKTNLLIGESISFLN